MPAGSPDLSIVVPVYNEERIVESACRQLMAALDARGFDYELILAENGKGGLATQGAIASRLAAELYGAQVLLDGIEDDPENYTRFLLLARDAGTQETANKTSIVFVLDNKPGALYRALGVFASRNVDLCKLQSPALRGHPSEYSFYLDVLGDPRGVAGAAIEELGRSCRELRILGSYPEWLSRNGA